MIVAFKVSLSDIFGCCCFGFTVVSGFVLFLKWCERLKIVSLSSGFVVELFVVLLLAVVLFDVLLFVVVFVVELKLEILCLKY